MGAAEKIEIPFTEAEAARRLGISKATLTRDRVAGKARPMLMGLRTIRYTDEILKEYRELCRAGSGKSETTGSVSGQARSTGAERGMPPTLDRQSAHRLALATFKRPSSR